MSMCLIILSLSPPCSPPPGLFLHRPSFLLSALLSLAPLRQYVRHEHRREREDNQRPDEVLQHGKEREGGREGEREGEKGNRKVEGMIFAWLRDHT